MFYANLRVKGLRGSNDTWLISSKAKLCREVPQYMHKLHIVAKKQVKEIIMYNKNGSLNLTTDAYCGTSIDPRVTTPQCNVL